MKQIKLTQMVSPEELAKQILDVVPTAKDERTPGYTIELAFPDGCAETYIREFNSSYDGGREILIAIVGREVKKGGYEIITSSTEHNGKVIKLQLIKRNKS